FYTSAPLCMQMKSTVASNLMDRFTVSLKAAVDHMYDTVIKPSLFHKYYTLIHERKPVQGEQTLNMLTRKEGHAHRSHGTPKTSRPKATEHQDQKELHASALQSSDESLILSEKPGRGWNQQKINLPTVMISSGIIFLHATSITPSFFIPSSVVGHLSGFHGLSVISVVRQLGIPSVNTQQWYGWVIWDYSELPGTDSSAAHSCMNHTKVGIWVKLV
ncbi:hypothetical protein STEG23_014099, partial [Scotinomys teguina]